MGLRSWWDKRMGRSERKGSTSIIGSADELEAYLLGVLPTAKSGQRVTYKTALQAATALACTKVVAEGLAQLPFKLYQKDLTGNRAPAVDHPLYDLLYTAPNDWQTSYEFMEMLGFHLMLCGNAFVWVNRVRGQVAELLPFEPQWVTVDRDGWALRYKIATDEGQQFELPASDVWHLRNSSWNGYLGLEPVALARESIGLAMATEEHGARLFKNGATVGGILSTEQTPTPEAREALRESWSARHFGGQNAFKTAILWGGMKWTPMGSDNEKTQYLELRAFQVEEQCRAMGVLPIMVGHSDKAATYASAEAMFQAHQTKTMQPKYRAIAVSANKALLTPRERAEGYYFKFGVNALMYANAKDRMEYLYKKWSTGAISANDWRELDEENPYPGGEKHYRPVNMAEINPDGPDLPLASKPDASPAGQPAEDGGENDGQV